MSGGFLSPETRGLFFHVFNTWERPQALFVAEAFSNTNDQQSQTYTRTGLDPPRVARQLERLFRKCLTEVYEPG